MVEFFWEFVKLELLELVEFFILLFHVKVSQSHAYRMQSHLTLPSFCVNPNNKPPVTYPYSSTYTTLVQYCT